MLSAHQLSYRHGGQTLLSKVCVNLVPGQVVGVIGPNGAGKSTLTKLMAGVLIPSSGRIEIAGESVGPGSGQVAYLPQKLEVHWPLPVAQVVALGRSQPAQANWRSLLNPALKIDAAVEHALQMLDLQALQHRAVDTLSGGELTRVLLARAIACGADYLLVDEPVNNLDPAYQFSIMQVLRKQAQSGVGVLAVLHDLSLVKRFCDQVVVLAQGRLVTQGAPADVLTPGLLTDVFSIQAEDLDHWLDKIG